MSDYASRLSQHESNFMGVDCIDYIIGRIYDRWDSINRFVENDHKESSRKGNDNRL